MLRASIESFDGEHDVTPGPIVSGVGTTGVAHGAAIIAFVDAVVLHDLDELPEARAVLEHSVGRAATDRVAMVAGNFSMMNRALDAIGAPVGRGLGVIAEELGLAVPAHLRPA